MHPNDAPPLESLETFINWYGIEKESETQLFEKWSSILQEVFHFKPRKVQRFLNDREIIDFGSLTVEIIHVPGHSPGHLAFFFSEQKTLFLGDNDLTAFGPWYGDLYSDIDQIITSIKRLRKIPAETWLASHENGVFEKLDDQVWDNYLAMIDQREQKLLDYLDEPRTLDEIARAWIVYGKPIKPIEEFQFIEKLSMKKHAERLIQKGIVALEKGKYRII